CSSCGALYNKDRYCSVDTFVRDPNKTPDSSKQSLSNCPNCGDPVDGLYCRPCAFVPKDGIFCQRCTCESCENGAHYGYNCPPKVPTISNPEPCHNQNVDEFPQTLPSFHLTCYSRDGSSFTYYSTPNFVDDSPNNRPAFCNNDDDDDEEYTIAITPILPTVEPDNSLNMRDEHLSTIPEKEESSVEDLVPIPSESEGISDSMCDVPFCDNSTPLEASKDHSEIFLDSNDDYSLSDDDSLYSEDIDYVDASPPNSELVSLEEVNDFDPENGEIDT
ncbi:hypothetical protein Tco_1423091, partial [Tanacetum coccineum]